MRRHPRSFGQGWLMTLLYGRLWLSCPRADLLPLDCFATLPAAACRGVVASSQFAGPCGQRRQDNVLLLGIEGTVRSRAHHQGKAIRQGKEGEQWYVVVYAVLL